MISREELAAMRKHFENDCDGCCERPERLIDTLEAAFKVIEAAKEAEKYSWDVEQLQDLVAALEAFTAPRGKES